MLLCCAMLCRLLICSGPDLTTMHAAVQMFWHGCHTTRVVRQPAAGSRRGRVARGHLGEAPCRSVASTKMSIGSPSPPPTSASRSPTPRTRSSCPLLWCAAVPVLSPSSTCPHPCLRSSNFGGHTRCVCCTCSDCGLHSHEGQEAPQGLTMAVCACCPRSSTFPCGAPVPTPACDSLSGVDCLCAFGRPTALHFT